MDLRDLRYFAAIAQSGSMTAAAKSLHVSQPTLTVAMQHLEEELKSQLLIRDRNGVRLTATGEELLKYATDVFSLLKRAEHRIKGLETGDEGRFVIGCHESLGAYFLPTFMARFLKRYPQIELLISNESSAMVTTSVVERRANFGLVVNPHPHPDLVIVKLFHDAMDVLIAANAPPPSIRLPSIPAEATKSSRPARPSSSERSPGSDSPSPDGEGQPQGFAEGTSERSDPAFLAATQRLLAGPLIYAGRVTQCQELCDLLAAQGLLSTRKLVCGDLELVKSLVLAGIGPALLPRRVAAYGHEGKLVRLHPSLPFIPDTICLVYRADMHQTKAALRVKDELIAHGRELDTEVHAVWNPLAV